MRTKAPAVDTSYHTAFKAWVIEKTFKRELAVLVLVLWTAITIKVFWFTEPQNIRALDSAYGSVTTTIWLYIVAAFGMDWMSKQMASSSGSKVASAYAGPGEGGVAAGATVRTEVTVEAPQPAADADYVKPGSRRVRGLEPVQGPPAGETDPSIPPAGKGS